MFDNPTPFIVNHYPMLDVFWTIVLFFAWLLWIFLLVRILGDIFRSPDLSGWAKAGWTAFVIVLPLLAVLVYLIARGDSMQRRETRRAEAGDEALRGYLQSVTGTSPSTAEELSKLAALRDQGVLTDAEFATQKAKLLG